MVVQDYELNHNRKVKCPEDKVKHVELPISTKRQLGVIHLRVISYLFDKIEFSVLHLEVQHHLESKTEGHVAILHPDFLEEESIQRDLDGFPESINKTLLLQIGLLLHHDPFLHVPDQLNLLHHGIIFYSFRV